MRYALAFVLAALCLTVGAIATFAHISAVSLASAESPSLGPTADTVPAAEVPSPVIPGSADLARFADADRAWRELHAHQYTIAELRARGDGKRTAREAMQDRVFTLTRRGDRAGAVAQLEQWVNGHPRDAESLLALARLLNEAGRTDEAVARYREILALRQQTH